MFPTLKATENKRPKLVKNRWNDDPQASAVREDINPTVDETYRLEDVQLPSPGRTSSADASKGTHPATINNSEARGTPLYALNRLRQDILVGLIRDLEKLSSERVPSSIEDKLVKALDRLQEVFLFSEEVFGKRIIESVRTYCDYIKKWIETGKESKLTEIDILMRQDYLKGASRARGEFAKTLSKGPSRNVSSDVLSRLDYWIWDIFSEIGDSPMFPNLYMSLRRFRSRAF